MLAMLDEEIEEETKRQQLSPDPLRTVMTYDPELLDGPCRIGTIAQNGFPYGLAVEQMRRHVLCLGATGGGKTTLVSTILWHALRDRPDLRILILEKKREFTCLVRARWAHFRVMDLAHLRINPLRPPAGVPHLLWLSVLTQLMTDFLDILVASGNYILETAAELLNMYACIRDADRPHPSLRDLLDFIKSKKYAGMSHYARHQETSINRLQGILNAFPGVFECDRGLEPSTLLSENVLLLLHRLPNVTYQDFLLNLLIAQLHAYREMTEGHRGGLANIIVLDEASSLFRRQRETQSKTSAMSGFLAQVRAYGMAVIAASQSTSDLSHALLANTATKILVGGLERGQDLREFIASRPTTPQQSDVILANRNPGQAFVADPRHDSFIECQVECPADLPRPLTEDEMSEAAGDWARELGWLSAPTTETDAQPEGQPPSDEPPGTSPPEPEPTQTAPDPLLILLCHVADDPFRRLQDRMVDLKLPRDTLKNQLDRLEDQGLVKRYRVHPGGSGRPRDLFEVTDKGWKQLNRPEQVLPGKGSYLHKWYQQKVSEFLGGQDYRTEIEGRADEKLVDLIARKLPDGETLGVEIELHAKTSDHFIQNLLDDLRSGLFDRVLCLVPTKPEERLVRKLIGKDPELAASLGTTVHVDLVGHYLGELD